MKVGPWGLVVHGPITFVLRAVDENTTRTTLQIVLAQCVHTDKPRDIHLKMQGQGVSRMDVADDLRHVQQRLDVHALPIVVKAIGIPIATGGHVDFPILRTSNGGKKHLKAHMFP
jgi:hypothetical protein